MRFFALVRFFEILSSLNSGKIRSDIEGAEKLHGSWAFFYFETHQNDVGKTPDFLGQPSCPASLYPPMMKIDIAIYLGNYLHAL